MLGTALPNVFSHCPMLSLAIKKVVLLPFSFFTRKMHWAAWGKYIGQRGPMHWAAWVYIGQCGPNVKDGHVWVT